MKKGMLIVLPIVLLVFVVIVLQLNNKAKVLPDENQVITKIVPSTSRNWSDYNIVLISVDTLRADHLGCYGYEKNTTPNIDKFARESILFEDAYSQAPSTVPALRSIMTGQLISNEDKNDITAYYYNRTYLAQILHKKGYRTAAFTDHYALGSKNEKRTFSIYRADTIVRGFDSFENFGHNIKEVTSHILTKHAIQWLDENGSKFFLWVHYFDPHFNYNPLPKYAGLFMPAGKECGRVYNGIDMSDIRKIQKTLTQQEVDCLRCLYDAEIFYTDEYIGKLLEKVKELGLLDKTVIIITADHGEEFKERTRIGHEKTVYNEVLHVPLIVRIPYQKPMRIEAGIATKQIYNVVVNLASNQPIEFYGGDVISRTYHYYKSGNTKPNDFCIISNNYKYIYNPGKVFCPSVKWDSSV